MHYLTARIEFSAAHRLYRTDWTEGENKEIFGVCFRPHGHNYVLDVTIRGELNSSTGMVCNVMDLKSMLMKEVHARMDHQDLNAAIPAFHDQVPTAENITFLIWEWIEKKIPAGQLYRVRLWETPKIYVDYYGRNTPDKS